MVFGFNRSLRTSVFGLRSSVSVLSVKKICYLRSSETFGFLTFGRSLIVTQRCGLDRLSPTCPPHSLLALLLHSPLALLARSGSLVRFSATGLCLCLCLRLCLGGERCRRTVIRLVDRRAIFNFIVPLFMYSYRLMMIVSVITIHERVEIRREAFGLARRSGRIQGIVSLSQMTKGEDAKTRKHEKSVTNLADGSTDRPTD